MSVTEQFASEGAPLPPEAVTPAAKIHTYIENRMVDPYFGNMAGDSSMAADCTETIYSAASNRLDIGVLAHDRYPGLEYNPILDELSGMAGSLNHNAGVYYSKEDVVDLFNVMTHTVLDDPSTQEQLNTSIASSFQYDQAFIAGVERHFSLNQNKPLAVVKDPETGWRPIDGRELAGDQDFSPLEITRQDNADKAGTQKYRFRQPTYTRHLDETHMQQVAEGWYTSDWIDEPSYWSTELRSALVNGVRGAEEQLQALSLDLIVLTEGGVLKGTATAGTDTDSGCIVVCNSPADFEPAYQATTSAFAEALAGVPFNIKKAEAVSSRFFDRTSGALYYRDDRTGEYRGYGWSNMFEGRLVSQIREFEQGIGITTKNGFMPFKKPVKREADGTAYVTVDLETGETCPLAGEDLVRYETSYQVWQEESRLRAVAADPEDNWI